ncbi:MAG: HD domain-containing protein [Thermaceae bacterium]|nr:HD domain-containing protein [Thermaceae bacterium]
MIGRLGRLFKALSPHLAQPDDDWALAELQVEEVSLYKAMDRRDREHAVKVAKRLLERYPDAPGYVVRAALLHDSGKASRPYRAWERILSSLWCPNVAIEPLRKNFYGAWQVRKHHPIYGARKILDLEVAALVREHHLPKSVWAVRLHEADREF